MEKLRAVLDGANQNQTPEEPSLAPICATQKQIKWEQLLLGRFAKEWNTHPRTQPGHNWKTLQNWTTEVIDFILLQWWNLWESRNQDRHGRDLATTQQAAAQQVDWEMTLLYDEYKGKVPQHLDWIFNTPIDVRRQWPTSTARQWLATWSQILHDATVPEADPTNPENYPYNTALETG